MHSNRTLKPQDAPTGGRRLPVWVIGLLAIGLVAIAVSGCGGGEPEPTPVPPTAKPVPTPTATATPETQPETIVDIAAGDDRFQTLAAALKAAGLAETLADQGPFTVFAPTDDAFAKLPAGAIDALLNDIPALTEILLYHVVQGNVMAADVVTLDSATTLQGGDLSINVDGDTVRINDARVVIADIQAANGTIHVIDSVLIPPQEVGSIVDIAAGDGRFQTLVAALQAAGLADTLSGEGPFTVFAPTDDAFAKLPAGTVEALPGTTSPRSRTSSYTTWSQGASWPPTSSRSTQRQPCRVVTYRSTSTAARYASTTRG